MGVFLSVFHPFLPELFNMRSLPKTMCHQKMTAMLSSHFASFDNMTSLFAQCGCIVHDRGIGLGAGHDLSILEVQNWSNVSHLPPTLVLPLHVTWCPGQRMLQ